MKTASLWKVAVVAVTVGLALAADVAMAGGDKVRHNNGNVNGSTVCTGTSSMTAAKQGIQKRDRLRDGSCLTTALKQQDRTQDRLRDGSCLTK
jgi:hypothetical protein